MPLRGVPNPNRNYNFDADPNWIEGSTYGTGLSYSSSDNPMYDAYYKANPYVNQVYNKTWIDKLFGGIFRTGYDKWLNEMQVNASQYDASVVDLEQSNLYNSESAQADRMRSAGLNADLLGTDNASESGGLQPDVQDVQLPDALDLSQVASFAGMIGKCFSGSFAMVKQGIDIIGAMSDITGNDISNASSMQDLALQVIRQRIPSEGFSSDEDYLSWIEGLYESPDLKWNQTLAHSLGLKRRDRKTFDDAYRNAIGSLPAELERFKMSNELADNRLSVARKTSSEFYNDSFQVMTEVNKILVEDSDSLQKLTAQNAVAKANVESQQIENESLESGIENVYLSEAQKLNFGKTRATIENEGFNISKIQQSVDKQLKRTRKKLLDMLEGLASGGNTFASYMIYNMMLHEYMNMEFKTDAGFSIGKHLPQGLKGWLPNIGLEGSLGISY